MLMNLGKKEEVPEHTEHDENVRTIGQETIA
jgi:hypothetical protein